MWDALSLLRSQDCVRPQFTFLLHAGIEELTREWLNGYYLHGSFRVNVITLTPDVNVVHEGKSVG